MSHPTMDGPSLLRRLWMRRMLELVCERGLVAGYAARQRDADAWRFAVEFAGCVPMAMKVEERRP